MVTCTSGWLILSYRFLLPLPQVWLICYSSSHNSEKHFIYYITDLLCKDITQELPDGRDAQGMGKGVELTCSLSTPLSPNLYEFTNLEALQPLPLGFYGCFITWAWLFTVANSIPSLSLFPRNQGMDLEVSLLLLHGCSPTPTPNTEPIPTCNPRVTSLTQQKASWLLSPLRKFWRF